MSVALHVCLKKNVHACMRETASLYVRTWACVQAAGQPECHFLVQDLFNLLNVFDLSPSYLSFLIPILFSLFICHYMLVAV